MCLWGFSFLFVKINVNSGASVQKRVRSLSRQTAIVVLGEGSSPGHFLCGLVAYQASTFNKSWGIIC